MRPTKNIKVLAMAYQGDLVVEFLTGPRTPGVAPSLPRETNVAERLRGLAHPE